ncbi:MAG: DUF402 domain-containing protein [Infirmifilum sp.]
MIRLRGIYATALAGLLTDAGYAFSDLSNKIQARIPYARVSGSGAKVTIKDLEHQKGIVIVGESSSVLHVYSLIASVVGSECSIVIKDGPYTSYRARVAERFREGYLVDLPGGRRGFMRSSKTHSIGDAVNAHVIRPDIFSPVLEEGVAISGDYVRVIEGAKHSVSEHIRDPELILELLSLASNYAPEGWGVRFRSSIRSAGVLSALEEMKKLLGEAVSIKRRAERVSEPAVLMEGESIAFVYFSPTLFARLDELRRKNHPTVPGHHLIKSLGNESLSAEVDAIEEGVEGGAKDLTELYVNKLQELLSRGVVRVFHEKPFGRGYSWSASVTEGINGFLRLERKIETEGVYDGLNVPKMPGDRIVSLTFPLSRFIVHLYFTSSYSLKGVYVNLNTPLDFTLSKPGLWYLDVALDVVWVPGEGGARTVDHAEFEILSASGLYPNRRLELYREAQRELVSVLSEDVGKLVDSPDFLLSLQERLWGERPENILRGLWLS